MARKLVLFHMHHPKWYAVFNAMVNVFVKGLPFATLSWWDGGLWMTGAVNAQQSALYAVMNIMNFFASLVAGMMMYLFFLGIWQVIKLLVCDYKKVNIHVHIFGIIIRLGSKKIMRSGDSEAIKALSLYRESIELRKEKIDHGKMKEDDRRRERDEWNLQYAKEERDRQRRNAADSRYAAETNYRKARSGGGLFTSAADEAERGRKNMEDAYYYEEQVAREEKRIAELEKRLRK